MNVLNILSRLSPPPVSTPEQYDGLEWRWKFLVFRPAYFKNEVYFLGVILFYVAFWYLGKSLNSKKVEKWMTFHLPILNAQFSRPNANSLMRDGNTDFFSFSTGRRNVTSLHVIFTLRPYHDLLQVIYQAVWSFVDLQYNPRDTLQLDFKLLPSALPSDFVWAVVSKDELAKVKDDRWDLTFTKTSENSQLPKNMTLMSEFADVAESIFKSTNILAVLQDPKIQPYFRSLSVTDQPRERPSSPLLPQQREKRVIVMLSVPSTSRAADTVDFVSALFPFIDSLSKVSLRPETKTKLKKTRDELDKSLKQDAEREKKEEIEQAREDQKAAKRKAEEERISKLSAAEQQKILDRERKRSIRKSQGKSVRRQ